MKKLIAAIVAILLAMGLGYGLVLGGEMGGLGILLIVGLLQLFGTLWAVISILMSEKKGIMILIWLVVAIFAPFGWLIYYFIGR